MNAAPEPNVAVIAPVEHATVKTTSGNTSSHAALNDTELPSTRTDTTFPLAVNCTIADPASPAATLTSADALVLPFAKAILPCMVNPEPSALERYVYSPIPLNVYKNPSNVWKCPKPLSAANVGSE